VLAARCSRRTRARLALVAHPSRLAIRTIDALAQAIALQAPLASGLPPRRASPSDARRSTSRRAQRRSPRPARDPTWRALLDHQDNNADALAAFLAAMLAQRDQWFALLRGDPAAMRAALEETLAREVAGELALHAPALQAADLGPLCRFATLASRQLGDDHAGLRDVLGACASRGGAPPIDVAHVDQWKAIAAWLLTSGDTLRRTAQRMPGIPPVGDGEGRQQRSDQAQEVARWLASLAAVPGFETALASIARLPPLRYDDDEWARIESAAVAAARARRATSDVFARRGELDFAQGTLAALAALGDGDAPTRAACCARPARRSHPGRRVPGHVVRAPRADRRLIAGLGRRRRAHALRGRRPDAVDLPLPRRRGARVRRGAGRRRDRRRGGRAADAAAQLPLAGGLVAWANATFPAVLGATNDPWRGRVAFAAAEPVKPRAAHEPSTVDFPRSAREEAERVVARVREALDAGGDVAILVRSRAHLARVLPALREAAIAYDAVELDVLAERPAVRDVAALAHAIVQPDDRLAWLAVLRAPWCGLPLADLHALVRAAEASGRAIEAVVRDPPAALGADAHARLARVAAAVARASDDAPHAPLAQRVHDAWLALGGPATLDDPLDLVAVDDVVALIEAHERAGDIDDWNALMQRLDELKLSPRPGEGARVQVMTMHKAKGLEFDAVILPGLASGRSRRDAPLLRWRTRRDGLMIGLAKPQGGEHDGVYAYLKVLADDEDRAELARLAYVACTRAKGRLALIASVKPRENPRSRALEWTPPAPGSLFGLLGAPGFDALAPPDAHDDATDEVDVPAFERLPAGWRPPEPPAPLVLRAPPRTVEETVPFEWVHERARRLGVVVHRALAQIAADGIGAWNDAALASRGDRWVAELVAEGALPSDAPLEAADVRATLATMLKDPRGRWLFDPLHEDARSEWALTGVDGGDTVHVVLDRTFVANGERWIVDFKTGTHEGADATGFLDAEVERYRPQLERYQRIVAALDPARPIRLALYHPRVPGGWREVL
jgi:hypothetical protein